MFDSNTFVLLGDVKTLAQPSGQPFRRWGDIPLIKNKFTAGDHTFKKIKTMQYTLVYDLLLFKA